MTFAEENESLYSLQDSRFNTGRQNTQDKPVVSEQKSSDNSNDSAEPINKLEALNAMLRNKEFKLSSNDDDHEFESYLSKLQQKRGINSETPAPIQEKVSYD